MASQTNSSSIDRSQLEALVDERIATTKQIYKRWEGNPEYRLRLRVDLMGLYLIKVNLIRKRRDSNMELEP